MTEYLNTLRISDPEHLGRVAPIAGLYDSISIITYPGISPEILQVLPKDVKSLLVQGTSELNYSALRSFTCLENLVVETSKSVTVDLSEVPSLRAANLRNIKPNSIVRNRNLIRLGLGLKYEKHSRDISANDSLQQLRLYRSSNSFVKLIQNASVLQLYIVDHTEPLLCSCLQGMPSLNFIQISGKCSLVEASKLGDLKHLETLNLDLAGPLDGLKALVGSTLRKIFIGKTLISDDSLEVLARSGVKILPESRLKGNTYET